MQSTTYFMSYFVAGPTKTSTEGVIINGFASSYVAIRLIIIKLSWA
jgi:hypothetical protein